MHRIDTSTATIDNLFTEGDPVGGTPATVVSADFLNALQEEICGVIEGAGSTLNKGNNAQLLAAIQNLIANNLPSVPPVPVEDLWMDPDYPGSNVSLGATAYRKVAAVQLADAAVQGFLGFATLPDHTRDYQLVIECAQTTAVAGKTIALKVEVHAVQAGELPSDNAADVSSTQAISCRADANLLVVENANFKILTANLHTDNQLVRVGIWRDGAGTGATDDHTGATNIYRAYFKAVA
jgi:hypothetical protein